MRDTVVLECSCGKVKLEVSGSPIISAECHCDSCSKAAKILRSLGAPTDFTSPTRRCVAACCNTPVFLEFRNGHWLSLYASLWPEGSTPAIEVRTMTVDRTDGFEFTDDLENAKTQPAIFMIKLLASWGAMGFRTSRAPVAAGGTLEVN